jgi:hypothetical protein
MTVAALAGDRHIGMVAVLLAQIASTHGNPGDFFDRMLGNHRRWRLLSDGRYNIVLSADKRSRIRCERLPTAAHLGRIAESERLEEAMIPKTARAVAKIEFARVSNSSPIVLRFAPAEPDAARTSHSGSLHRLSDVVEKLRNCKNKSKILRFFEIRSASISARSTLQQGANKPEGRLRSAWNEIAIPVANSSFPSVSRRFSSTLIGVDKGAAIGVTWDCENR